MNNVSSGDFKVLSIDAWAGDNEFSWEWNDWHYIDSIRLVDINDNSEILTALVEHGFIKASAMNRVDLEDDSINVVVVNKDTREPLYAIEYINGPTGDEPNPVYPEGKYQ
jgi:hypothetical protein